MTKQTKPPVITARARRGAHRPIEFKGEKSKSRTEQQYKDEVKIQNILGKRERLGIQSFNQNVMQQPQYFQDLAEMPDFETAMNTIALANTMFEEVPAKIRETFRNDPGQFLEFLTDPDNIEEIQSYGFDTEHLENVQKPLSKGEEEQIHIETLVKESIAREQAPTSLQDASIDQLQAQIDKMRQNQENG